MYYSIGFVFGDPVIFLRHNGRETLVCSNFERDEARRHGRVSEVLSFQDLGFAELLRQFPARHLAFTEMVLRLVQSRDIQALTVTGEIPLYIADRLRETGIALQSDPDVLLAARARKRPDEVAAIEVAQHATERAMARAIELITASEAAQGCLWLDGQPLTAERVRTAIDLVFLEEDCVAEGTIVAGGSDAASPHNRGAGQLPANKAIVLDIFPRHSRNRYFADMTRTVSKGDPGPALRTMYEATLRAHEQALALIRPGANGQDIYDAVCRVYEEAGYATSLRDGRYPPTGFIHSLGHGVGLEIHEGPHLSARDEILREGHVVTVEPGLYDPAVGGVRIEDLVVVTADGCRNLTHYEKRFVV
jgi:Xaa-Pro aminopeptidase